jgi:formylglycine-generating enzyme required for sulfatase activity
MKLLKFLLFPLIFVLPAYIFNGFVTYKLTIPNSNESIQFVAIQGGKFTMGNNAIPTESPEHVMEVSDFWMSVHEVTWQQYELFVRRDKNNADPISNEKLKELGIDGVSRATQPYTDMSFGMGKEGFPAVNITQYAALSYCKWLSALTGDFYRLPTEAEWEYTAKGGILHDYFTVINSLDDYAWHKGNSSSHYHAVGLKKPNSLGLYDILGNVSEWTMDAYAPYENKSTKDFWRIPQELYPRVARGGSWMDERSKITPTHRIDSQPGWKIRDPQLPKSRWWHTNAPFIGFRIVRPRVQPTPEEIIKYWLKPIEDYN